MKAFLYKAKGAVALTIAMSMFCPQVFAAEALSAAEQGVQESPAVEVTADEIIAEAKPVMTIEKALDRAKKYSAKLKDLEDDLEQKEDTYEDLPSVKIPSYNYKKWRDDKEYGLVTQVFMVEKGIESLKTSRKVTEISTEFGLRGSFIAIKMMEEGLEMSKKAADLQETAYKQGQVKHRVGMLSTYKLNELKVAAEQARADATNLEAQLEQQYISFNRTIGENPDTRFEFVYDVTFKPMEMTHSLDQYILNAMKEDPMIEIQELTTEMMKFSANVRPTSDTNASADDAKLTYDKQKRALKTAKEDTELAIRKAYLDIKQMETDYETAKNDLAKAQADFRATQLSYQVGGVTKTAVEGAEMAVTAADSALKQLVYEYDLQVFMFENPFLLTLANSVAAQ